MKTALIKILPFLLCLVFFSNCTRKDKVQLEDKDSFKLVDEYLEKANSSSITIDERIKDTEKALVLLNGFKDDTSKSKRLLKITKVYLTLNDSIRFHKSIINTIKYTKSISDSASLGFIYNRLAFYYNKKNRLDSVYSNYNKAEKVYSKLNDDEHSYNHGKSLLGMAIAQRKIKDYSQSISTTFKAIKRFQSSRKNTNNYLSICYSSLGIVFNNLENYNKAIEYHKESIHYAKNIKNEDLRKVLAYNNIGVVHINQKKYEDAIESFNKGLGYKGYLKKDSKRKALLLDNLAYANFLLGKDNIINQFLEPLRIRDSINDKIGITTSNLHLAEYYKTFGKDSLAKLYAEKSRDVSKLINHNRNLLDSYQILSGLYKNDKALDYANAYIKLNDSLVREERLNRDKLARIRFETDQKEQQIIEVQNRNTIYLLGMLLLLTIISFTFFFFRQRTKYLAQQNKIVQFQASYDTETRISKRLHDELGNDIFQVMMQYQHNPQDPTIPEKLNTTYNKARDISRENSEFETGTSYPSELSNMLQNYTQNEVQLILRGLDKIDWNTLDETIKITVYRVLQEFMTNMQKHSQATLVALVFSNIGNQLEIKYSDNGVGMDESDQKSSNGLRNTEKRIQAINGTLTFTSEKDKGFKAEIKIPS